MQGVGRAVYILTVLLTLSGPAAGQGWVLEASAGAAEYEAVAGEVGSLNAILGARRDGPIWLSFSAGVPLDSAAVPWATAGTGGRWSRWARGVELGLELAALGFGYRVSEASATGGGATLVGLPFVAFQAGAARVEVRSGALHHANVYDGETSSRTVHDSGARAWLPLTTAVTLEGEGRLLRASEASYPYAGAALHLVRGRLTTWLRGGRWMADDLSASGWGIGGSIALPGRLQLRGGYERAADDPLYWNGPRSSWSIGLSRALGRRAAFEALPPSPAAFRVSPGGVALRVPASEVTAGPPSVSGDFTDWKPVPMQLRDGVWEARFDLPPGLYRYSFQRPDGSWFLPDSVENRVDDGFGGVNGVLVVAHE